MSISVSVKTPRGTTMPITPRKLAHLWLASEMGSPAEFDDIMEKLDGLVRIGFMSQEELSDIMTIANIEKRYINVNNQAWYDAYLK